jgi:hypothetical protein
MAKIMGIRYLITATPKLAKKITAALEKGQA